MGRWELFQHFWHLNDDDSSPVTDASTANDSMVEERITTFQKTSKEITDSLAALSAERIAAYNHLREIMDTVTLAYGAALGGDLERVRFHLEKVINSGD